jgi:Phosphodiester glycosidase
MLEDGLELGTFHSKIPTLFGSSEVTVLRVDPKLWDIKLYTIQEFGYDTGISAKKWSKRHHLSVAINAGMYLHDVTTHVGYLKAGEVIQSRHINRYQSVAGFSPKDNTLTPFRIFDLDEEDTDLTKITEQYSHVVQNMRLIKRPGENRWAQQNKKWNEAALGEDKQGRALLIYSRSRLSMHDFNELILSLPIDLVSAQHLEGGKEAQLYINHPKHTQEIINSFENPFFGQSNSLKAWPIPNIIGVSKKDSTTQQPD